MPLTMLPIGRKAKIVDCTAAAGMKQHLCNIGFLPGTEVQVINEARGNLIVEVKGVRLALSRGLAQKLLVTA